jgi:hypothetical protein
VRAGVQQPGLDHADFCTISRRQPRQAQLDSTRLDSTHCSFFFCPAQPSPALRDASALQNLPPPPPAVNQRTIRTRFPSFGCVLAALFLTFLCPAQPCNVASDSPFSSCKSCGRVFSIIVGPRSDLGDLCQGVLHCDVTDLISVVLLPHTTLASWSILRSCWAVGAVMQGACLAGFVSLQRQFHTTIL